MNILDSKFKYTPAALTDIRKTFARIRKQQVEQQQAEKVALAEAAYKVRKLR